jgi:squalene synthase HpnC
MFTERADARAAYRWCRALAGSHYENFPVASALLPARMRDPVAAVYAFARSADDIADEGQSSDAERLRQLDDMAGALEAIESGRTGDEPLYLALADSVARHRLPLQPFHDLLSAFRQDVRKKRYADFGELMDYCRRSANPVGTLLLHLNGAASPRNLALSDAVCSALQLINFLQDIAQDYRENDRIYLPVADMARFGVTEDDIAERRASPAVRALVQFQVRRAAQLLRSGSPLGARLRGRFGLEIRAIILGGSRILDKVHQQEDPFGRPRLGRSEKLMILWQGLLRGFNRPARRYRIDAPAKR